MKILLLTIGQTPESLLKKVTDEYIDRLKHYVGFTLTTLPDVRNVKSLTQDQRKVAEGKQLLAALQLGDQVILLDERGKEYTSEEFASVIQSRMVSGVKRLVFIVGGPYGFSKEVYDAVGQSKIALSRMTLTHDMVRLFFIEQLYRAFTILNNQPYHH